MRGASRLDAFSVYPFRTWLPGHGFGKPTEEIMDEDHLNDIYDYFKESTTDKIDDAMDELGLTILYKNGIQPI